MPNVTTVNITNGVPDTGTGTVSTLDNLVGTAGTASAQVLSIQGITAMTPIATNLTQVAGASVATGHGTASGAIRVELPTDGTGVLATVSTVTTVGTVTSVTQNADVRQSTASNLNAQVVGNAASAATDSGNPVKAGGKYNSSPITITDGQRGDLQLDANAYLKVSIAAAPATNISTNLAQIAGNGVSAGNGASGTGVLRVTVANDSTGILAAVTNVATIGTSVTPGTGAANLGKAEDAGHSSGDTGVFVLGVRNDALTAFSNTDLDYTPIALEGTGRVMCDVAPSAAMVRGTATTTGTSDTSLVAASGSASLKTYITSVQIANTGVTTSLITFKDGNAGSTLGYTIAPSGGGSNIDFAVPLVTTANTAFYFAAGSASTTIYASAQGYKAP